MSIQSNPYVLLPVRQTNSLGTTGFVISLVGLVVTGGILCPIGLLLSLIALGKQPRGLAVAGVILGLIGSCAGLLIFLAFGALILAALGIGVAAVSMAMADPEGAELTIDMGQIAAAVEMQRDRDGYLPATLSGLGLDSNLLTDPWGSAYEYVLTSESEKPGFELISFGPDRVNGSDDDLKFSRLDDYWDDFFKVTEQSTGKTGSMDIKVGNRTIHLSGDDQNSLIEIDLGDKVMRLKGGQQGPGSVTIVPKAEAGSAPEPPKPGEPAEPTKPAEPAEPAPASAPPSPDSP